MKMRVKPSDILCPVSTTNKGDGTITKREGKERVEVRIAGGQEGREEKKKKRRGVG